MKQPEFVVTSRGQFHRTPGHFVLQEDNWNDYGYLTLFHLVYYDASGEMDIGAVKIANAGMSASFSSPTGRSAKTQLPRTFHELDGGSFSLGQDREYYEKLRALPDGLGTAVLRSLNDIAADEQLFARYADEPVLQTSLMRDLSKVTIDTQFRRIIAGHDALTPYRFSFTRTSPYSQSPPFRMDFSVHPDRFPPSNVHVLIGSNGVGKSKLLRDLVIAGADPTAPGIGLLRDETTDIYVNQDVSPFAGIVHVGFSAFESDRPVVPARGAGVTVKLVGLESATSQDLAQQYIDSLRRCKSGPRRARWLRAMEILSAADGLLADLNIAALLDLPDDVGTSIFTSMSSGHKIVVLTMSRLVESVEERTLVLIDEPETHLHPPLLSALIRSVSDLLMERNGVAIVATHSPVVLQEVPKSCVWVLRRVGDDLRVWQLDTESFGESVSRLTSEVFHLEVRRTGYHRVLERLLHDHHGSSEGVLLAVGDQLGSEGRFVLSALAQGYGTDA